jgi:hypothetical protein
LQKVMLCAEQVNEKALWRLMMKTCVMKCKIYWLLMTSHYFRHVLSLHIVFFIIDLSIPAVIASLNNIHSDAV